MTDHEERVRRAAKLIRDKSILTTSIVGGEYCRSIPRCYTRLGLSIDDIACFIKWHLPEPPSPWVSVDAEEKPRPCDMVALMKTNGIWSEGYYLDGQWYRDDGMLFSNGIVTHWMPLPPLPEKENDRLGINPKSPYTGGYP